MNIHKGLVSRLMVDSLIQSAWSIESSHPEKATLIYKNIQT